METVCNALFGRYLDQFLSFVETFTDCPAEFILMKDNVVRILTLIEDVEKVDHGMKSLEHVTKQLRELMYEAEDRTADYSQLSLGDRHTVGTKLKDINEKLKEMKSELESSVNAIIGSGRKRKDVVKRRQPQPINDVTDQVFGVGDAVSKIKKWILNKDKEIEKVDYNCVGLVGKGGSGKTTLAQMILKDEEINQHFQSLQRQQSEDKESKHSIKKIMFVDVSQPVNVKMIMTSMLKQLGIYMIGNCDEQGMSTTIYEALKESRYFLILDDIWSLDDGWLGKTTNALPKGNENCILITSRIKNIVRQMGVRAERTHEHGALGEEHSWNLFCWNISTDDVSTNMELKEIGMEIVRNCAGLPLALKVMAGVVSSCDISTSQWRRVKNEFMEYISKNKNIDSVVMGSLRLSYDDLRLTYLQQCLLCFGVFPEDREIDKNTMIRWWIGEGFVPLTEDGRVSVEMAEKCFEELVNRSLVEVVKRDYKGKVLICKLHDLVREMLFQKRKSEAFFEIGKEKISKLF